MIKAGERLDDLNIKGRFLIQNPKGFCFGLDAVLLVHFAAAKPSEKVLDLGTGTGIIPILMSAYYPKTTYCGMEIQPEYAEMASRSVAYNHLQNRIQIMEGDFMQLDTMMEPASFDRITVNPPYMNAGIVPKQPDKAIARHEILCNLDGLIRNAVYVLKPQGSLCLVHRPNRLPEIICTLKQYGLEPKRLRMVQPKKKEEPNLFLLEAVKGANSYLRMEPVLIVYGEDGNYTEEISEIYRFQK